MRFVRWDPLQEMLALGHRLGRDPFRREPLEREPHEPHTPDVEEPHAPWMPAVDILERPEELVVRVDLPGVAREDIDVRVEDGVLGVHGERKPEAGAEVVAHRTERAFGTFGRHFTLPTTLDAARIAASFRNGVLELTIPRTEAARPTRIEIKAS